MSDGIDEMFIKFKNIRDTIEAKRKQIIDDIYNMIDVEIKKYKKNIENIEDIELFKSVTDLKFVDINKTEISSELFDITQCYNIFISDILYPGFDPAVNGAKVKISKLRSMILSKYCNDVLNSERGELMCQTVKERFEQVKNGKFPDFVIIE